MTGPINVIIDARMIDEHLHGIARYAYELIKYGANSKKVKYYLLVNNEKKSKKIFNEIKGLEFIEMKSKFLSLSEQVELPKIVNNFQGDVIFHSPSFVASPLIKKPMIMTIHDLNHLRFPEFYTPFHKYYYKFIVKTSAKKSQKILTVSNFSKNELLEWLECHDEKIKVTYNGIDESFKKVTDIDELNKIRQKYNLPSKFVLYVGNQKPHKNVATLIKAFKEIKEDAYLVMNGKASEENQNIINELGLENRIKYIGFVDDKDLATLYSLAEVFVFPSLYEGFGLPPLEAMACGCPIIVSKSSSLPEVVGDYGVKFEATDYSELAANINKLLNNDKSISNDEVMKWIERYSWKRTGLDTIKIYRMIRGGGNE